MAHPLMAPFFERLVLEASEGNDKDRVVARRDTEGEWWAAAWSGHTLDGVVGPSVLVEANAVPRILAHGSYRRHSGSIQRQGIIRGRRDIHLHDPDEHSEKWRKDIETKIVVDTGIALNKGCRFRTTGNQVWLCDKDIPVAAIREIVPWDGLRVGSSRRVPGLHHGTGQWAPCAETRTAPLITEEVAQVAREIAQNLPEKEGALEVTVEEGTLQPCEEVGPETRSVSGSSSECDWSGDESASVECVQAIPAASSSSSKDVKMEHADEPQPGAKIEEGSPQDVKMETMGAAEARTAEEARREAELFEAAQQPVRRVMKGEIEEVAAESKVLVEDAPPRRKPIKLGSAHLHILKAVADADAANWESLQTALREVSGSGKVKEELVGWLTQLSEARLSSKAAALREAEEHSDKAQKIAEAETNYRASLDQEMARLEKFNPVGPRAGVPLISGDRLTREIEAGRPIWQARREHKARERAARHRQLQADQLRAGRTSEPGPLMDVDPSEGGQVLDDALAKRAKEELRAFRQELKEEAGQEKGGKPRAKDSKRRQKLKKQRRKDGKRNKNDDAERDSNHAVAHSLCAPLCLWRSTGRKAGNSRRPEASILPGLSRSAFLALWERL